MSEIDVPADPPAEPVIDEPLSVDVVGDDVVLDGVPGVDVTLSPNAAIETGVKLINAGITIDDKSWR